MLVRAIYKDGQIQPLEPIDLVENQELTLIVDKPNQELTPDEVEARLRAAGLLMEFDDDDDEGEELTPQERERIGRLFATDRPVEDDIREDRDAR